MSCLDGLIALFPGALQRICLRRALRHDQSKSNLDTYTEVLGSSRWPRSLVKAAALRTYGQPISLASTLPAETLGSGSRRSNTRSNSSPQQHTNSFGNMLVHLRARPQLPRLKGMHRQAGVHEYDFKILGMSGRSSGRYIEIKGAFPTTDRHIICQMSWAQTPCWVQVRRMGRCFALFFGVSFGLTDRHIIDQMSWSLGPLLGPGPAHGEVFRIALSCLFRIVTS